MFGNSSDDDYYKNYKRRQDSFDEKSKRRYRHIAEEELYNRDSRKSSRRYKNEDYRERSSSHHKKYERYSVSSGSESDGNSKEDFKKSRSPIRQNKHTQSKPLISEKNKDRRSRKVESDSDSGEDALTSHKKLVLSSLGFDVNQIPAEVRYPPNNRDGSMKDKKSSKNDKSEQIDDLKKVFEERRVWTNKPSLARDSEYVEDQNDIRRVELKARNKSHSKWEDKKVQGRNKKDDDDDLIALNIKQCRDMVINIKDDETSREGECEEIRNVRVQPLSERNKHKKRCFVDLDRERSPTETKRFKKFDSDEEKNDWKKDKTRFHEEKRSVKGRRKHRSSSSSSEDSCSSYKRKSRKSSKRHHSRDPLYQKQKTESNWDRQYNEKDYDKSYVKTSPAPFSNVQPKPEVKKEKSMTQYDYFDEGSHWCEKCNIVYEDAVDYLKHLHSDTHQKLVRNDPKPWATDIKEEVRIKARGRISVPLKGLEFLSGTSAFYCKLCSLLIPDVKMAEKHLKGDDHNAEYREFLQKNPRYQKRRTLDVEPRMFQAIRIDHQEDDCFENSAPSEDLNKMNEIIIFKQKHDLLETKPELKIEKSIKSNDKAITMKESTCLEKDVKPDLPSRVRETVKKQEPVIMEIKPKVEKVTLDIKSTKNNNNNVMQAKDTSTTSSMSSFKKLPFIGKRPSKMTIKSETETTKPATTPSTNSASLSRDELLSRVMKDTVIVAPKGIQISPFPGVPPEAMMRGCVNNYMLASYMGYAPYGGYYDMNLYYDTNNTCAATPSESTAPKPSCSNQEPIQTASTEVENAADVEQESDAMQQDHYENYTIGNDSNLFENIDEVKEPDNNLCTDKPSEKVSDDKPENITVGKLEVTHDRSEEVTHDKLEEVTHAKFEEVIDDKTEEVVEEKPEEVIDDKPEVIDDKAEEVVDDKAEEVVDDKAEEVVDDKTEEVVDNKTEEVIDDKTEEVAENKPCESVTDCTQDNIEESDLPKPMEVSEPENKMVSDE